MEQDHRPNKTRTKITEGIKQVEEEVIFQCNFSVPCGAKAVTVMSQ